MTELTREEFEMAVLRTLIEINETLRIMAEFHNRLGEAIEMLAREMGYEFTIQDEATA